MRLFRGKRVRRHGIIRDTPLDGDDRCRECSADCCQGFPSVELSAEEYALLESLGAKRLQFTLNERFYLLIENGCEFLVENRCSIYSQRPRVCRLFTCED